MKTVTLTNGEIVSLLLASDARRCELEDRIRSIKTGKEGFTGEVSQKVLPVWEKELADLLNATEKLS